MPPQSGLRVRSGMRARPTDESHRTSTPLELLFDLTFVVATSRIVLELVHGIEDGHGIQGVVPFLSVFFAIWWAWMNFTWFASAYDTDDVLYRVLTMVQMGGVLLLAAGVPAAFTEADYLAVTLGYFIMRFGLVLQWLRAARGDPAGRSTALRYAFGVGIVQIGWWGRLFLPESLTPITFPVLVLLELAVPIWAERDHRTSWHPHHIAERYGLHDHPARRESARGIHRRAGRARRGRGQRAARGGRGGIGGAALRPLVAVLPRASGEGLERRPELVYYWGYGHYFVFAALAAVGGGLEVAVVSVVHPVEASSVALGYTVALPVAVFLVLLWMLHAPLVRRLVIRPSALLAVTALILLLPLAAGVIGLTGVVAGVALLCSLLIAVTIADNAKGVPVDAAPTPAAER